MYSRLFTQKGVTSAITPCTPQKTNMPFPSTSPTANSIPPGPLSVAASMEKRSAQPLPKARKVTPATAWLMLQILDMVLSDGMRNGTCAVSHAKSTKVHSRRKTPPIQGCLSKLQYGSSR